MKFTTKYFDEKQLQNQLSSYVLGVDVGGTNTNVAIAGILNKKPILLFSLNFKSKELESLVPAISETLKFAKANYSIDVDMACIGAAGVVSSNQTSSQLTNVRWNIDIDEVIKNTSLKEAFIINDFQAIGYGINLLDLKNPKDVFEVRSQKHSNTSTKAILGAGTGLGKSILVYDQHLEAYIPIPSEGGHCDLPLQNNAELELAEYIKKLRKITQPLSYEEVLSGRGIEGIYAFIKNMEQFKPSKITKEIDVTAEKAPLISQYKKSDETCAETFRLFTKFYARCAKNYVLDTMATGGLYIAGGIASKNKEIFTSKEFLVEFGDAYRRFDSLKNVPIHLIVNYDVSLYGTCLAALHKNLNEN